MDMFVRRAYRGQTQDLHADTTSSAAYNCRYVILASDFCRLYRQHNLRNFGIDINISPENNVHNWMDSDSPYHKPHIFEAVFKYLPRLERGDRFKICIATSEMRDAAWQYCHKKQLVLDGTFGLCTSRLLLWIALGVDSSNNGIPVALFLFSAPTGNKATHAGYDTRILEELLGYWNSWLGVHPATSEPFSPYVAMTDSDTKERSALASVWPSVILLLCRFHLLQCWTTKRGSVVASISDNSFWKIVIEKGLDSLQKRCVIPL